MLGESVFSLNLWLNPHCGKQLGIDILLMMCNCFFMIFQLIIGSNILVFLSGYLFLSLLLYNRCLGDFKPLLLLESAVILHSGLHTLMNFLFPRRDFLLLPFVFDIDLCGPTVCANLSALLLDLRWYLGFFIQGLEIHWEKYSMLINRIELWSRGII